MNSPALFDLSPRTVLRVSGPDRERFLNGQVTQDVRLASDTTAVFSAVLNAKGQLEAVCWIREEGGAFLVDAPMELRDALMARLDRYLIADEVELSDESDSWHLAHLTGGEAPAGIRGWTCTRLGSPGIDLLAREAITVEGVPRAGADDFERIRIESGIPAWGAELTPGLLPPDAGLEESAISYDKGCYLGQEVISRMKRAGKTNQHLVRLVVPESTPVPSVLVHQDQEAGRLTSRSGTAGLGFRKRKFAQVAEFELRGEDGEALDGVATVR